MRHEPSPNWTVTVRNLDREPIVSAKLTVSIEGRPPTEHDLSQIASGTSQEVVLAFDTTLRPDTYPVTCTVTIPGETTRRVTEASSVELVPRAVPGRMPVLMWGIYGTREVLTELPRLKQISLSLGNSATTSLTPPMPHITTGMRPGTDRGTSTTDLDSVICCGGSPGMVTEKVTGYVSGRNVVSNENSASCAEPAAIMGRSTSCGKWPLMVTVSFVPLSGSGLIFASTVVCDSPRMRRQHVAPRFSAHRTTHLF